MWAVVHRREFLTATGALTVAAAAASISSACAPSAGTPEPEELLDLLFPPDQRRRIRVVRPRNPSAPPVLTPTGSLRVLVVGGGIAGLSAALELAERGYAVELREASDVLGGRLATRDLDPGLGETFRVEHGLHMWFDNYRTFADIRHRLGVDHLFRPYREVDFVFRDYEPERLESSPKLFPANLAGIIDRSPNLDWPDVVGSAGLLPDLFQFDFRRVYDRLDHLTFDEWMDQVGVTRRFRDVILKPAADVTLNDESRLSAAEMVMYQHLFFTSQPFAFDREVTTVDHATAVIDPWAERLEGLGTRILRSSPVPGLRVEDGRAVGVVGEGDRYDAIVLATSVPGAQQVLSGSTATDGSGGLARLRDRVEEMRVAPPYRIVRLWFDRPLDPSRPEVIETPQRAPLVLICQFHQLEDEPRAWAERTGGSVIELHLYALSEDLATVPDDEVWPRVRALVLEVTPELSEAQVLGTTVGTYRDFSAFEAGLAARRPFPTTPVDDGVDGLYLAGDWVAAPVPSALMERSVLTGRLAANEILVSCGIREAAYSHVSGRGPLA